MNLVPEYICLGGASLAEKELRSRMTAAKSNIVDLPLQCDTHVIPSLPQHVL